MYLRKLKAALLTASQNPADIQRLGVCLPRLVYNAILSQAVLPYQTSQQKSALGCCFRSFIEHNSHPATAPAESMTQLGNTAYHGCCASDPKAGRCLMPGTVSHHLIALWIWNLSVKVTCCNILEGNKNHTLINRKKRWKSRKNVERYPLSS